ncbi:MAG: acyl-CoA dehydratase activase [Spirochaetota bacterium]
MITAGFDIGSTTAKAVVLDGDSILGNVIVPVEGSPKDAADVLLEALSKQIGIDHNTVEALCGTGYGQKNIPYATMMESEIVCHAKAALYVDKDVRTIIDIGGQDAKVCRIDGYGNVQRFVYNDKCASGTGKFLEITADVLEVPIEQLAHLDTQGTKEIALSNQCVVFAESEIISLLNSGEQMGNIVRGLHRALASRVASLALSIGVEQKIAFTGGVAHNAGMRKALENVLKTSVVVHEWCQVMGALGAALIAREKAMNRVAS